MVELLKKYEHEIETMSLIPSGNGKFEVMVNDNLIFSKESIGRHAEEGEVDRLLQESL